MTRVMRPSRFFVFVLAAILLISQSVAFAYEQTHGTTMEAGTTQSAPFSHDGGKGKDGCAHCAHGGHFQSHFLGDMTQTAPDSLLPLVGDMTIDIAPLRIPLSSLEPPYRPPRIPDSFRTV